MSVAVQYDFIPAEPIPFPQSRGLLLDMVVQRATPDSEGPTGEPLTGVELGAVVVITVQVTSFDDVGPARVELPMPAGLEALDPNVATDLPQLCDFPFFGQGSYFWWFDCPELTVTPTLVTIDFA